MKYKLKDEAKKITITVQPIDLRCDCNGGNLFEIKIMANDTFVICPECHNARPLKEILAFSEEYRDSLKLNKALE